MKSIIFLVDMNSFFVSCELVRQPQYKKKALVIASREKRSVISAASYTAKNMGIDSAMPLQTALMKAPDLLVVPPDFEYYRKCSKQIMSYLGNFSKQVVPASIDEAYIDVSHYFVNEEITKDKILKLATFIQGSIFKTLGLPCNIGISSTKFLAKMASELRKPFAIETLFPKEIEEKLWPLPIGAMHGVGKKTTQVLEYLNIKTIGDFATFENEALLEQLLGKSIIEQINRARGQQVKAQELLPNEERKSISQSRTFTEDVTNFPIIEKKLVELWDNVVEELTRKKLSVRGIKAFYKQSDFTTIQKSKTLDEYTNNFDQLYQQILNLFLMIWEGEEIRLVGLGVFDLIGFSQFTEQLTIFEVSSDAFKEKIKQEKLKNIKQNLAKTYDIKMANEITKLNEKDE